MTRSRPARHSLPATLLVLALVLVSLAVMIQAGGGSALGPGQPQAAAPTQPAGAHELVSLEPPGEAPERAELGEVAELPESSAELGSTETAPAGPPFRGRVVDAVTREPVPDILIEAGPLRIEDDGRGSFDAGTPLPTGVDQVRVHDPVKGTHIRDAGVDQFEFEADAAGGADLTVIPILVGPTFPFRVAGMQGSLPEGWSARVVEEDPEDRSGAWGWESPAPMGADPTVFRIRMDNPQQRRFEDSRLFLEVRAGDGVRSGRAEVPGLVGVQPIVGIVLDRSLASVRGRVVSADAVDGVHVALLPRTVDGSAREGFDTRTGDGGEFLLGGLDPGRYTLFLTDEHRPSPAPRGVELAPGFNDLGEVSIAPASRGPEAITGRVLSTRGARLEDILIRLRSVDGTLERYERAAQQRMSWAGSQPFFQDRTDRFSFDELPENRYEVEVLGGDGYPWSPPVALVATPQQEPIVFTRLDDEAALAYFLTAVDAGSGEELRDPRAQVHLAGELWLDSDRVDDDQPMVALAPGTPFRYTLYADGYRIHRGTEADFQGSGRELRARIELRRGASALLHLRALASADDLDLRRRGDRLALDGSAPIVGAEVLADGVRVGTSDAAGRVFVDLDAEPTHWQIRKPGWIVLESDAFEQGRIANDERELVIWMLPD